MEPVDHTAERAEVDRKGCSPFGERPTQANDVSRHNVPTAVSWGSDFLRIRGGQRVSLRGVDWALLSVLPQEARSAVVAAARARRFDRGEVVFHWGDLGDAVHLVRRGRFAVRVNNAAGETATLRVLGPGEAFGELALVHPGSHHRSATVSALEPGETLSISGRTFTSLRDRYHGLDRLLAHLLAERVEQLSERLLEAHYLNVDTRVFRRLVELAAVYGCGTECPTIPIRQEDIASMAGTTRPTVNQILRRLADEGTVSLRRGTIVIEDLQRLRARARIGRTLG